MMMYGKIHRCLSIGTGVGNLLASRLDASGKLPPFGSGVWTSTGSNGRHVLPNCDNFTSQQALGRKGTAFALNQMWTDATSVSCELLAPIYCISRGRIDATTTPPPQFVTATPQSVTTTPREATTFSFTTKPVIATTTTTTVRLFCVMINVVIRDDFGNIFHWLVVDVDTIASANP
jgi:hypothetical protein